MSSQVLSLPGKKIINHLSLQKKVASTPGSFRTRKEPGVEAKKKVEVIGTAQNNLTMNIRTLGEIFKCEKTQVARILKCKDSLVTQYNANASGSRVHTSSIPCVSEFAEVNKTLYDLYILACSKNIYPAGPQLIEKAKQIAEHLGKSDFKGSNGWLEKWKRIYNYIKELSICEESGDVHGKTIDSWKERIPEIVQGYTKDDIWNMDETGVFWKALLNRGFGQKGKECRGGKKHKQRIFCYSYWYKGEASGNLQIRESTLSA